MAEVGGHVTLTQRGTSPFLTVAVLRCSDVHIGGVVEGGGGPLTQVLKSAYNYVDKSDC